MTGKINESLRAELDVRLVTTAGKEVYSGTAAWAGLEVSEHARGVLGSGPGWTA